MDILQKYYTLQRLEPREQYYLLDSYEIAQAVI